MEHQIKLIAEAIKSQATRMLVESHVKEVMMGDNGHLTLEVDNAQPLHSLSEKENDEHLRKALEAVYGDAVETYELKLHKSAKPYDRGRRFFGKIKGDHNA